MMTTSLHVTRRSALACLAAAPWMLPHIASAQGAWPSRPIRFVVTFAAGGSTSNFARVLAEPLSQSLSQTVLVDNRPGAGGLIGVDHVAKSPPDGYAFVMTAANTTAIAPAVRGEAMPYVPLRDLTPIIHLINQPNVLVANKDVPTRTFADFIAWAKHNPGAGFATPGVGTTNHIMGELLASNLDIQLTHIPYNGAARIIADLLGGAVKLVSFNIVDAAPLIADGRVNPIMVTTEARSALFPDVPTMQELGASSFPMSSWQGIFGPAGLPAPIVARLNAAFNDALTKPSAQEWIRMNGATPVGGTPEALRQFVEREQKLWGGLVRRFNVTIT